MTDRYRILAEKMIRGDGTTVDDACVVIDGSEIAYAGTASAAPPGGEQIEAVAVMPGMWDAHCHFFGIREANLERLATDPPPLRALRSGEDALRALMAGFTSVRDMGGLGTYLAAAIEEGAILGPHVYAAGSIISTTGGHGDIHSLPERFVETDPRIQDLELCDGVPECLGAVRRQLRKGARVIKVCASGGVLSQLDLPEHAQFSPEELEAIVTEAARADRIVAAHCHGKAGIMAALRAGVKTIEHGTFLDEEAARAMADEGAILVSTRLVGEDLLREDSTLPAFARRKLEITYRRGREALQHAMSEGVTIAAGTDILTSGDAWGRNGRELGLLVEAGLAPSDAIVAATGNGPKTIGPQAPRTGLLTEGHDADVLAVSADPLDDIHHLADPDSISHVWLRGELVKRPPSVPSHLDRPARQPKYQ